MCSSLTMLGLYEADFVAWVCASRCLITEQRSCSVRLEFEQTSEHKHTLACACGKPIRAAVTDCYNFFKRYCAMGKCLGVTKT